MSVFEQLGLGKLDTHFWQLLASAAFIHFVFLAGGWLSRSNPHYARLTPLKKAAWCIHIVSVVFSVIICTASAPIFFMPELEADRLFGYSYYAGSVYAFACGYFLWDTVISIYYIKESGLGFVLHGVTCFFVFLLSFRPFLQYFGCVFLMFELSTVFLNVHWFCDKTGRTGTRLQWINGIFLITTFFSVRIVFGFYQSYRYFATCYALWDIVPKHLFYFYATADTILCSLNLWWFWRMIQSITSRFKGEISEADSSYDKTHKKAAGAVETDKTK
ncbi:hypothetical protein HK105_206821 [Polyrhizophydium stewartii]|uniref:TLC domain-containing protein n=1 Tax=Polyrhizophydium stewartii TaxID=2732419 RepID=A0ABR4N2A3_9FUNG|nr:hypothetical protein HK105_001566 [Polyrhizophydium stewartii]